MAGRAIFLFQDDAMWGIFMIRGCKSRRWQACAMTEVRHCCFGRAPQIARAYAGSQSRTYGAYRPHRIAVASATNLLTPKMSEAVAVVRLRAVLQPPRPDSARPPPEPAHRPVAGLRPGIRFFVLLR